MEKDTGTGYGAYKATRPGFIGGDLFPNEEQDEIPVASVCDEFGTIQWLYTNELQVVEVDGKRIEDFKEKLSVSNDRVQEKHKSEEVQICPACDFKVDYNRVECPSCGLTLVIEE
ncbi:hypothetical protein VQL36_08285 [Chengkuizengella sp. SCS-71B]|uniref:hypothetical protein n=1 Tax=Chengkuizengella sp. SCS-71B TaxID=3115290 RepID=UPI0032C23F54